MHTRVEDYCTLHHTALRYTAIGNDIVVAARCVALPVARCHRQSTAANKHTYMDIHVMMASGRPDKPPGVPPVCLSVCLSREVR